MTKIRKRCEKCGIRLTESDWNRDYFIHLCNTQGCPLFHQPQGSRPKYSETEAALRGLVR